jgi:uncharacterized phage-associated protein
MYTALEIADWFRGAVDRPAGDSVTHLKLQKLVYYAQAWSLALLGRPLFSEDLRAWAHGPVALSVWREFKEHGWEALPAPDEMPQFDEETTELLRDVLRSYGEHSAKKLEDLTHAEEPWLRARGGLPPEAKSNAVIPKEHMKRFYGKLYEEVGEPE